MASIDWDTVTSAGTRQTLDLLTSNHRYLVMMVVRNNPVAVAELLEIKGHRPGVDTLTELILVMDEEEQTELLNSVPYIQGQNPELDKAFAIMAEEARAAGMQGASGSHGPQKFVVAAVLALAGAAQAYLGMKSEQERADAAEHAEAMEARAEANAKAAAQAKAKQRLASLKKALPWVAVIVIIAILIGHKVLQ